MPRSASLVTTAGLMSTQIVRTLDGRQDGIVVFLDPESGLINVLYRRVNGELTLVEIEI